MVPSSNTEVGIGKKEFQIPKLSCYWARVLYVVDSSSALLFRLGNVSAKSVLLFIRCELSRCI